MPKSRNSKKGGKKRKPAAPLRRKTQLPLVPDLRAMDGFMKSAVLGRPDSPGRAAAAQDLIYGAWETRDPRRRIDMAHKALKLSPDCADARVLLAEEAAISVEQAAEFYRKGMQAGERALGKRPFREDVGHFWGILETRPYMRARGGYAQTLERLDRREEAVEHYRGMLRLNPNDNQGNRYLLLRLLVELARDREAEELICEYDDEATAAWAYTRALLVYRGGRGLEEATALLQDAIGLNRFVPQFLLGKRRLPRRLPEYVGFGDESEAAVYASEFKEIWRSTSGAVRWLQEIGDADLGNP